MTLTTDVLDALKHHPCDAETLAQRLPDVGQSEVDDALAELVAGGAVVEQHLQTLPPRTLYRVSEAPASPSDADDVR